MAGADLCEYCSSVEASKGGRKRLEVEGGLSKLSTGGQRVSALHVQQAHSHLDQRVMKEAERVRGITPKVLQRLVGLPEASRAQKLEAGAQCEGETAVVGVGWAVALEAFEPEGILLGASKRHGATS